MNCLSCGITIRDTPMVFSFDFSISRVLAISDIHGEIEKIKKLLNFNLNIDAILIAGDFEIGIKSVLDLLSKKAPVFFIRGNLDPKRPTPIVENTYCIDNDIVIFKNFSLIGIGHSGFLLNKAIETLSKVQLPRKTIVLLTHVPPYNTVDITYSGSHIGSRRLRDYIERVHPYIVLSGHVHESGGKTMFINDTMIVNVSGIINSRGCIIDIKNRELQWLYLK